MSGRKKLPAPGASAIALKRPTQTAYNKLEKSTRGKLSTLAGKLAGGKIDAAGWESGFLAILEDKHGAAAALGRQRAGDLTPRDAGDNLLGALIAEEQGKFLASFRADIESGRYGPLDALDQDKIARRSGRYAQVLLATTNEAFVQSSDPADTFDWHMGAVEDHCTDCPALAAGGPYTALTIPTYPRGGATACLHNCKCALVRSDGITGFNPPELPIG